MSFLVFAILCFVAVSAFDIVSSAVLRNLTIKSPDAESYDKWD